MAVDWSKLSLIDTYGEKSDAGGKALQARFLLAIGDWGSRPTRGDTGSTEAFLALYGTAWTQAAGTGAVQLDVFVNAVTCDPLNQFQHLVSVEWLKSLPYDARQSKTDLLNQHDIECGKEMLKIEPAWAGVRKRDLPTDVITGASVPNRKPDISLAASCTGVEQWTTDGFTGTSGAQENVAQWAARLPESCPFTHKPHPKWADQAVECIKATATFYADDADLEAYGEFGGVMTGIPSWMSVPQRETSGYWRAWDQTVKLIKDPDGNQLLQIVRTIIGVPLYATDYGGTNYLRWDTGKIGTETW